MKKEIKVYTSPTCVHCGNLKKALTDAKVEFTEINAIENAEEWDIMGYTTGLKTFPTTVIGNNYFIPGRDYNTPEQLVQYANSIDELDNVGNDVKLLEAFKTLTFSLKQMMSRVIQQLNAIEGKLNKEEENVD